MYIKRHNNLIYIYDSSLHLTLHVYSHFYYITSVQKLKEFRLKLITQHNQ